MKQLPLFILILLSSNTLFAQSMEERTIDKEVIVEATPEEVFKRWTTSEGVARFFCENNTVEPWVFGKFEMYFLPEAPEGQRGGEGCKFLYLVPNELIGFTWNFPPSIPSLRNSPHQTTVLLEITPEGSTQTHVRLRNFGYATTATGDIPEADWDKAYLYFQQAWTAVLGNLQKSFEQK